MTSPTVDTVPLACGHARVVVPAILEIAERTGDNRLWCERCSAQRDIAGMPRQRPRYVYVASSWRNDIQPAVVELLRANDIACYDFKNPEGSTGFSWSEIDPDWQTWTAEQYVGALQHPRAIRGYESDFHAMQRADTFVLVLPSGRSAHLELGWAVGRGKRTCILTRDGEEPELMARMVDHITTTGEDLLAWLGVTR